MRHTAEYKAARVVFDVNTSNAINEKEAAEDLLEIAIEAQEMIAENHDAALSNAVASSTSSVVSGGESQAQ